jgi:hypothetical protein
MKRHSASAGILLALFLLGSSQGLAASDQAANFATLAEGLIQEVIRSFQPKQVAEVQYREERLTRRLDRKGNIASLERAAFEWRIEGGKRSYRLLELNGGRTTPSPEFSSSGSDSSVRGWDLNAWRSQYDFKLAGTETIDQLLTIRIHFSPKKVQPPARGRLQRVVQKLEGDLWLAVESQTLLKASLVLSRPVRFGGLMGIIRDLRIDYSQQRWGEYFVPHTFNFGIEMRQLFKTVRLSEKRTYGDFRLSATAAPGA